MTETLFDIAVLVTPTGARSLTIAERFDVFHAANPWVADALEALAADWLAHGHNRVGVKALVEIVRWQYGRRTRGSAFRLDNTLTSHYARLLIERRPEWAQHIETRELRAA